MTRLQRLDWPDNGTPDLPPAFSLPEAEARLRPPTRAAMAAGGLCGAGHLWRPGACGEPALADRVRSHGSKRRCWSSPRRRALDWRATNAWPTRRSRPWSRGGMVRTGLCASLSLPSQPRGTKAALGVAGRDHPGSGAHVGAVGWKWYGADELPPGAGPGSGAGYPGVPGRSAARAARGRVENATALFMHPGHGLRARVTVEDIARLEFSPTTWRRRRLRRMVFAFHEGMTDFAAVEAARIGGLPLGCHRDLRHGRDAGPVGADRGSDRSRGKPASFNVAHWGSNICRAGWMARGPK